MQRGDFAMKRWVWWSTAAVGLLAAGGAAALSNIVLAGSDAQSAPLQELLVSGGRCPGAVGLLYQAGGANAGQSALVAGTQQVAPMGRFVQGWSTFRDASPPFPDAGFVPPVLTGACLLPVSEQQQTEGLVIGLDAIHVLGSTATVGSFPCNGLAEGCPPDGSIALQPWGLATGDVFGGTNVQYVLPSGGAATYVLHGWQDVLRILYFGKLTGTTPDDVDNLGCANPIRVALANNWGSLFQNGGCAGSGNGLGIAPCTQLQHLFRPDDASEVADIFSSLLGVDPPDTTSNVVNQEIGIPTVDGGGRAEVYGMGSDSFCNDYQNLSGGRFKPVWPGSNPPNGYQNGVFTTFTALGQGSNPVPFGNAGIVPNDDQDYDPIRRPCAGNGPADGTASFPNPSEQVCERGTFDVMNTTAILRNLSDGGVDFTYNCGANDAGVCPGNEICYAPANSGTQTSSQQGFPSGQCWGSVDLGASQVQTGTKASCAAGGGAGSCPFAEPCLLDDGGVPPAGTPGRCWSKPSQGSLGLLLPMVESTGLSTPDPNSVGINMQYNTKPGSGSTAGPLNLCSDRTIISPPFVYKYSALGAPARSRAPCPNGDSSLLAGNVCYVPADANGNPNCLSLAGVNPITTVQCSQGGNNGLPGTNGGGQATLDGKACSGYGPDPVHTDPRVYNLYSYRQTGTCSSTNPATGECNGWTGNWVMATDDSPVAPGATTARPLFGGAYFRIHTSQDMLVPNVASFDATGKTSMLCHQGGATSDQAACPTICTQKAMSDQIACLVQASPCSLGIANSQAVHDVALNLGGHAGALSGTPSTATPLKIGLFDPAPSCLQTGQYPLWHKLYLNTFGGFQNVGGQELALAQCEATGSIITPALTDFGMAPLPDAGPNAINGGNPYCEDFDEKDVCGSTPANSVPGCLGAAAGSLPTTACGNGIVEAFEECDWNASAGPPCNGACRRLPVAIVCTGSGPFLWHPDRDGDGFGDANTTLTTQTCVQPPGFVLDNGDCCDSDPNAHPGQTLVFQAPDACGNFNYACSGGTP
jgi:hypothetical protein